MIGPKPVYGRMTGQFAMVLYLDGKEGFDCAVYQYHGINSERGTVAASLRVRKYWIWGKPGFQE